jgi:hypothetical protein
MTLGLSTYLLAAVPVGGATGNSEADGLLGAWRLNYTSPDGKARECIIALSHDGTALRGDYWDGKTTRPANSVALDRGELSFWVDGRYAGRRYTLTYKGRRNGDALRGAVHWKYGWASGSMDFVGKRIVTVSSARPSPAQAR